MRTALLIIILAAAARGQPSYKKQLFIEAREKGTSRRNITLELTKEVIKRCGETVAVTADKTHADYSLAITPGASTLYLPDGNVDHIFTARWTVSGLSKETCGYIVQKVQDSNFKAMDARIEDSRANMIKVCHDTFKATSDKKVSDLTAREASDVRICEKEGVYF